MGTTILTSGPMMDIRRIARDYCDRSGIGRVAERNPIRCDATFHRSVASAYDRLVSDVLGDTLRAYTALIGEVDSQFMALQDAGIRFISFGDNYADPYGNRSDAMATDVIWNRRLFVYSGGSDHPILSRSENWRFRAVHDVFGHAMHGYSFGPNGEESAYRCHSAMFSPIACKALATETRGQNSWVNFGPHSHLPRSERPFAIQKAAILPEKFRLAY